MKKLKSLKVKMPLIIISIVIVFIIILIAITDFKASDTIKNTAFSGYQNTASGYASLIDTWFEYQLTVANTYTKSKEIKTYLSERTEESKNEVLNYIKDVKALNSYFINIGLSDVNGNVLLDSDDQNLIGKNILDLNPDVKAKINSNEKNLFGHEIRISEITGSFSLILLERVFNNNNQLTGYIYIFYWIGLH